MNRPNQSRKPALRAPRRARPRRSHGAAISALPRRTICQERRVLGLLQKGQMSRRFLRTPQ